MVRMATTSVYSTRVLSVRVLSGDHHTCRVKQVAGQQSAGHVIPVDNIARDGDVDGDACILVIVLFSETVQRSVNY